MYAHTALTPAEQAAVPTPGYTPLRWDELAMVVSLPRGERPRVYGFIEPLDGERYGQIVSIESDYHLDLHAGRLSFAWMTDTTISDLIGRA